MPEFILDAGDDTAARKLHEVGAFAAGYVECMFFTSTGTGDDDDDLEHATVAELAPETWRKIIDDCAAFEQAAEVLLAEACDCPGYDATRAGHDFWYTRNHHGVGYWDRSELGDDLGRQLTEAAQRFREINLYRGDDG
jgi:hypothetical protein